MKGQSFKIRDFQQMFIEATQKDAEKEKVIIDDLKERREKLLEELDDKLYSTAETLTQKFLASKAYETADDVAKNYLMKKQLAILGSFYEAVKKAKQKYFHFLAGINFDDPKYRCILFNPDPFKKEFEEVEQEIDKLRQRIGSISRELDYIISRNNMTMIKMMKQKAVELIEKCLDPSTDSFGIYKEMYINKRGKIYLREYKYIDEETGKKCYWKKICIYNPQTHEETPFMIFTSSRKLKTKLQQQYGNSVIQMYDSYYFFKDFIIILSILLKHCKIEVSPWDMITIEAE